MKPFSSVRRTALGLLYVALSLQCWSRSVKAQEVEQAAPIAVAETQLHWSDSSTALTKDGQSYHGPWGNQTVAVSLKQLPPHQWVRVRFDLYVYGTWDGSSPVWGPDLWSLSVRGAQRLIFASLCAWGYAGNDEQSYPDDFPRVIHPAWTAVSERDVLDVKDSNPPKNGVYQVEVLFPHTSEEAVLDFAGAYQDPHAEPQRWGIGNLKVQTQSAATLTEEAALPELWKQLIDADPAKANGALWQMVGAGAKAVTFIDEQVEQSPKGLDLSDEEGLRLQRAHRIVRIIDAKGSRGLCFKIDQISLEYAKKYGGQ